MDDVTRIKKQKCPYCGLEVDALGAVEQDGCTPKPGDYVVCVKCASLQVIGEDLELLKSDPEALKKLKEEKPDVWKAAMNARQAVKTIKFGSTYGVPLYRGSGNWREYD